MKKIPSLFKRDYEGTHQIYDEIVPGCEWVQAGEGTATVKIDGTACMVRDGKLYRRYDAKPGRTPPPDWEPCEDAPDPNTGHWPGWLPVEDGPQDQYYREAWRDSGTLPNGTYELIGPKFQTNPYRLQAHWFKRHGAELPATDPPRDFAGLRTWFEWNPIEGIVWWRDLSDPNCDKCKIKRRDFGLPWPDA